MNLLKILWAAGSRQDQEAFAACILVDEAARGIPHSRNILPLINKVRPVTLQNQARSISSSLKCGWVIQSIHALRMSKRSPCFSTPFRTNNLNAAKSTQQQLKLVICYPWTVTWLIKNSHVLLYFSIRFNLINFRLYILRQFCFRFYAT